MARYEITHTNKDGKVKHLYAIEGKSSESILKLYRKCFDFDSFDMVSVILKNLNSEVYRKSEKQINGHWFETYTETDESAVYRQLAYAFIAKEHKAPALYRTTLQKDVCTFYYNYGSFKMRESYRIKD